MKTKYFKARIKYPDHSLRLLSMVELSAEDISATLALAGIDCGEVVSIKSKPKGWFSRPQKRARRK